MSNDIQLVQGALTQLDAVQAGIKALQEQYSGVVYPVQTTKGLEDAKAARMAIRKPRYEVERIRKDAKAPLLALQRRLDGAAKTIEGELLAIEDPIDKQIKTEEDRREAERQAKVKAEVERVEKIQARIQAIRDMPLRSGRTAAAAEAALAEVGGLQVDDSFEEFKVSASSAVEAAGARLKEIVEERHASEAEAERLKAEREDLARQRREDEERQRVAREQQEAADRVERERLAAERAELDRLRTEQEAREKAERERIAAEEKRLADDRAALERERTPMQEQPEPAVAPAPQPAPTQVATLRIRPKDIVVRLRAAAASGDSAMGTSALLSEAADTIERLRRDLNEEAREAQRSAQDAFAEGRATERAEANGGW